MSTLSVERRQDGVAVVTIDHPPVNLMTVAVFIELATVVTELDDDPSVRVIVFRSASPEWFIAHFDVEAILGFPADQPRTDEPNSFQQMCERLRTMDTPSIAQIEGRVGGGGSEFALSCDMRFVTPDAVLSQPEVAIGILPGGSGTVRLPRLIGRSRALEVILGCDDIDAETAERWGWVNRILPADDIGDHVDRLARRIASFPPHAVRAAKARVVAAEPNVHEHLVAEAAAFDATLGDPSTRSAMREFLDLGGQTVEGERRLGQLAGEVGAAGAARPHDDDHAGGPVPG